MFRTAFLGLLACLLLPPVARAETVTLACLEVGRAVEACRASAQRFSEATGHTVRVVSADPSGRRALQNYRQIFSVSSPRLDVLQFPAGWAPVLAGDLATLDEEAEAPPLPSLREAGIEDDRRVGLPHHMAITILYLREGMFEAPPEHWYQLRERLLATEGENARVSFAGEGDELFPFVVDWVYSFGADGLADSDVLREALAALDASIGELSFTNAAAATGRDAVNAFGSGAASVLMVRSTSASAVQALEREAPASFIGRLQRRGIEETPKLATTWLLGVSRHSDTPEVARELAQFLASEAEQRAAARDFRVSPVAGAIYEDEAFLADLPVVAEIARRRGQLTLGPVDDFGRATLELTDDVSRAVREFVRGERTLDETVAAVVAAATQARRRQS